MISFCVNLARGIRLLLILSKYRIIDDLSLEISNSKTLKFLVFISYLIFPIKIFYKSKETFATRINKALQKMGPTYIKFGQIISTRPDLVGEEIAGHLKQLQDRLPAFDNAIAWQVFKKEFGLDFDKAFQITKISKPVAAASISQVYCVTDFKGDKYAVKFLRPNIERNYAKDIELQKFLARVFNIFASKLQRLKLREVVNVLEQVMHRELDLRLEAASISEMSENFKKDSTIHIPNILWDFTSKKILTLEWVDGISIYDRHALLEAKIDTVELSKKLAIMSFNQTYRDGFFHADLHPGNILITRDARIALIDFGIVGRLRDIDRIAVAEILYYFTQRNYYKVAQIHSNVGYIPANSDIDLFAQYCRAIAEPIRGLSIREISIGKILTQLFELSERFGMEIQPQLLLLQKNIIIIEGIGQILNPDINMWKLIEPWIEKWVAKNISFEAKLVKNIKMCIANIMDFK
ncbi:MAG: 2-polyprenylphenol 6-hydroxylase [Rickettsiaceae bacterium]|nr:2-polyprenylphenol 6-hydroxylase [Rickettsiaceae bacterium]